MAGSFAPYPIAIIINPPPTNRHTTQVGICGWIQLLFALLAFNLKFASLCLPFRKPLSCALSSVHCHNTCLPDWPTACTFHHPFAVHHLILPRFCTFMITSTSSISLCLVKMLMLDEMLMARPRRRWVAAKSRYEYAQLAQRRPTPLEH